MVQITSVIVAVMVAATPVAQAAACNPGFIYCGHTLERHSYDPEKIRQAIKKAHFPLKDSDEIMFHCNSDESITARRVCGGFCVTGGEGENDECYA
ncbi:hypothetical protein E4U23_006246 [Claviceps purpurea]|nr:hypothetical protein E4U23_006246 [Claviceps purpurea]